MDTCRMLDAHKARTRAYADAIDAAIRAVSVVAPAAFPDPADVGVGHITWSFDPPDEHFSESHASTARPVREPLHGGRVTVSGPYVPWMNAPRTTTLWFTVIDRGEVKFKVSALPHDCSPAATQFVDALCKLLQPDAVPATR